MVAVPLSVLLVSIFNSGKLSTLRTVESLLAAAALFVHCREKLLSLLSFRLRDFLFFCLPLTNVRTIVVLFGAIVVVR